MTAPLSPAAQAVLTAFSKHPLHGDHIANDLMHGALPAALRAAADQVVRADPLMGIDCIIYAKDILAIAAELEANPWLTY